MNATTDQSARGVYSDRVRRLFAAPAHAGDLPQVDAVRAEASEGGAGARILLTAVTDDGRIVGLRFRVFGCPHLIAAAEWLCERIEGEPVKSLANFSVSDVMSALEIPVEKTGRVLLLEDSAQALLEALVGEDQ